MRLKRILKRVLFTLIVLVALGCAAFWWVMRRTLPEHAARIPAGVPFVATINIRELALDVFFGGELSPDTSSSAASRSSDRDALEKAMKDNGGGGLSWRKDVLAFAQLDEKGKPLYFAGVVALSDADKFTGLASSFIAKRMHGTVHQQGAIRTLYSDSSGLLLAWGAEELLLLKGMSCDSAFLAAEVVKLFAQQREQSVLSDADFCSHEKNESFDVALWINLGRLKLSDRFSELPLPGWNPEGNAYVHLLVQFNSGEVRILQKNIASAQPAGKTFVSRPADPKPLLFSDPEKLSLFWSGRLPEGAAFEKSPAGVWLQEQSGNAQAWRNALEGSFSLALQDSIRYPRKYIAFDYDENFELKQTERTVPEKVPGFTLAFSVKNKRTLDELAAAWAKKDSLEGGNGTWKLRSDIPVYMRITDDRLVFTTFPQVVLKAHPVEELAAAKGEGARAFVSVPKLIGGFSADSLSAPQREVLRYTQRIMGDLIFSTPPSAAQGTAISQLRLLFVNRKVNALVQLAELAKRY